MAIVTMHGSFLEAARRFKDISQGKTVDAHVNYPNMLLDKTTIDSEEAKAYGLWGDAK